MTGPRYLPRSAWGPKLDTGRRMPGPASEAWIHWAVKKATSNPAADMRAIEETGRQRFGIFSYSYCYHPPTRTWYEGAGFTVGAHTGGRNSRSLGLSLIAAPGADDMPHLVEDTAWMLRLLIERGELKPGAYPSGGHRDLKATECPGSKAYALIPEIRAALAGGPTPPSEEDDMTPEQAKQLAEVHKALTDPKNGLVERVAQVWRETVKARDADGKGYLQRSLDALLARKG